MSNRTLIELNHDFCPRDNDAELLAWARTLRNFMSSGSPDQLPRGVTFKVTRHHSEECQLDADAAIIEQLWRDYNSAAKALRRRFCDEGVNGDADLRLLKFCERAGIVKPGRTR